MTDRPRRSVLYMPAANARALEKARSLAADTLIFDLEDAVQPDAKETARAQAVEAAGSGAYGNREVIIRCNALDTPWGETDIKAIAGSGADGILLPKVSRPEDVVDVVELLDRAGAESMPVWAMMETPLACLNAQAIAASSPRLAVLVVGTADLAKDLRAQPEADRAPLLTALSMIILAARSSGLAVLDGVYVNFQDADGFEAECRQGLTFGFDGKTLIHPSQIDIANATFAPSAEEVEEARRMIAAWEEARAEGKGLAVLDGKMVEELHVTVARERVAMAEMIAARTQS